MNSPGRLSPLSGKTGTAAGDIVQLDSAAKLPAVDGSQLTGVSAAELSDGAASAIIQNFAGTEMPQLTLSPNCGIGMSGNTFIFQIITGTGDSVWGVDAIGGTGLALSAAQVVLGAHQPGYFQIVATVAVMDMLIVESGAAQDAAAITMGVGGIRYTQAAADQTSDIENIVGSGSIVTGDTAEGYSFDVLIPYNYSNAASAFVASESMEGWDYTKHCEMFYDGSAWIPGQCAVPATTTSPGHAGSFAVGGGYLYVCTATDTWCRIAVAGTW